MPTHCGVANESVANESVRTLARGHVIRVCVYLSVMGQPFNIGYVFFYCQNSFFFGVGGRNQSSFCQVIHPWLGLKYIGIIIIQEKKILHACPK